MAENKSSLLDLIPKSVDKAVENLTGPITNKAGTTLGDIWYLVFGSITSAAEKRRLKYAHDLEQFKKDLEAKIDSIPSERRIEPDLHIVGPALENAKYCIGKEALSKMFANLISNSMDSTKTDEIHPSFGEIIKQMTPLDAQNLALFKGEHALPFCEYRVYYPDGNYAILHSLVFIHNPQQLNIDLQAQSISSLCRLGLLEINALSKMEPSDKIYEPFSRTKMFKEVEALAKANNGTATVFGRKLQTTYLGEAFISVCLP